MNINLDYYKTFYYVAKLGSITEAAHVLMNNQPNVTKTIQNLERELGCTLFERSRKGVTLTDEGQALYSRVLIVMRELDSALQDIEDLKQLEKGKVVIATTEIALHGILLQSLKEYKKAYPNIQLSVSNQTTKDALDTVKNGDADFALVTGITDEYSDFDIIPLKTFQDIAVCSDYYNELLGSKISYKEISSYPIVSLNENTVYYDFYKELFRNHNVSFTTTVTAASLDQILPLVAYDLGVGFVPEFYFDKVSNYLNVKRILLESEIPTRTIFMIKRKNSAGSSASRALEELILQLARSLF